MNPSPRCPACKQARFRTIGEKVFHRQLPPKDEFGALRYRVLFEVWQPHAGSLKIEIVLCLSCGFVGYTPRATEEEVDAKYRFIARHADRKVPSDRVTALDSKRSKDLFAFVRRFVQKGAILDFGGGNGALLDSFVRAGFDCSVVDYVSPSVPGVQRLGATLEDVVPGRTFQMIVASHVFEHLAEPVAIGRKLREYLAPKGVLMVEVPLEILGGLPRLSEPVTHVNFFCESSLGLTLSRAGFVVEKSKIAAVLTEHGNVRYAVRVIARPRPDFGGESVPLPGASEAMRLLSAGSLARFGRALGNPLMLLHRARRFTGERADLSGAHA